MTSLVEGEVQDSALVAYVIVINMLYLSMRLSIYAQITATETRHFTITTNLYDDCRNHTASPASVPHHRFAPQFLLHTEFHLRRRRSVSTAEGMLVIMSMLSY